MTAPPLSPPPGIRDAAQRPLESVRFTGLDPGPRLIVLGAVHGNEVCGPAAIRRAIDVCRDGTLAIRRGTVTFVPVVNAKANAQGTREGDRNLNRNLAEKPLPADYEDRIGNVLCRLLREHDVLLDIHSFNSEGAPFVFFGPEDNAGPLEPFARAAAEAAFAAALGPATLMYGWLPGFARLIEERRAAGLGAPALTEGFGTTEFMRFSGGYGVTIECGRHDEAAAVDVAGSAIRNALAHLGLIDAPPPPKAATRVIRITEMLLCRAAGDCLAGSWRTGDAVDKGALIARRADGSEVHAPSACFIVFPKPDAKPGECLCYLGVTSSR